MKKLLLAIICLAALVVFAANPTFQSFLASQFSTTSTTVSIRDGATVTNLTNYGTFQLPDQAGGTGVFLAVDAAGNVTPDFPPQGDVTNNGTGYSFGAVTDTNLTIPTGGTLTANQATVLVSNALVQIVSLTNATYGGYVTNITNALYWVTPLSTNLIVNGP